MKIQKLYISSYTKLFQNRVNYNRNLNLVKMNDAPPWSSQSAQKNMADGASRGSKLLLDGLSRGTRWTVWVLCLSLWRRVWAGLWLWMVRWGLAISGWRRMLHMLRSSSRRHKLLARWLPCNDYSPRMAVSVVGATSAATASHDGYNDRHDDQTADDYTNDATSG